MEKRFDTKFYRVREPLTPRKFAGVLSREISEEEAQCERSGWAWLLDRREVDREDLETLAEELGANVLRAYPLPDEQGELSVEALLLFRAPGTVNQSVWNKVPRIPYRALQKSRNRFGAEPKRVNIADYAEEIIDKYRPLLLRLANEEQEKEGAEE